MEIGPQNERLNYKNNQQLKGKQYQLPNSLRADINHRSNSHKTSCFIL